MLITACFVEMYILFRNSLYYYYLLLLVSIHNHAKILVNRETHDANEPICIPTIHFYCFILLGLFLKFARKVYMQQDL